MYATDPPTTDAAPKAPPVLAQAADPATETPATQTTGYQPGNTAAVGHGAPRGNANAVTSGLRASSLPRGAEYVEREIRRFRAVIRQEIIATHGRVSTYDEAVLQSATRHETRALLAARWLRKGGETIPLDQRLALLSTISAATEARDRCLRAIRLDIDSPSSAIDALYSTPYSREPASEPAESQDQPTEE